MAKGNWYDRVTSEFVQNVANIYLQESGIPAFSVFPEISSRKLSGKIAEYDKDDWFYIGNVADYLRSGATESAGDDYETSKQDYTCLQYSFHKDVPKEEADEYDNPFAPVEDASRFVVNRLRRVITKHLVDTYIASGVWGTDIVGGVDFTKWSDSSSTPIANVLLWKEAIHKVTGFSPNRLIVSPDVHRTLRTNTNILAQMKTTSDKEVTKGLIARLFEVDDYVVVDTVNSGATGYMIDNRFLLMYTPSTPSKMEPSAGYTIMYKNKNLESIETDRIELKTKNKALRVEGDVYACPITLGTDLGMYGSLVV